MATLSYADEGMKTVLLELQHSWAKVKYETPEDKREAAFEKLSSDAEKLARQYPGRAEPLIWQAIILSTQAGESGGLGALRLVKEARGLLLAAEKINPEVLQGSVYTSLGSLYYQVPGWPLGFGDDDKAEKYLQQALALNPKGIDPNFFYADYLYEQGRYKEAMAYVQRTLDAPARQQRPLADDGRRREANVLMQKIQQKLAFYDEFKEVSMT
ncbi:MAG: hypothetical protein GWO88_00825 [Planctomycetia bacterium]|nr:hypothetical protein [Planctomycetia bacterium]